MAGEDPDHHRRDLRDAIAAGDAPEWRLEVQVMPFADAADYRFNPFDLTKVWPHGRLPADRGRPPGARPQPGELLRRGRAGRLLPVEPRARHRPSPGQDADGRGSSATTTRTCTGSARTTSSCRSTARSRPVHSYNKDGPMTYHHAGDQPVYAPNSYGGPAADPARGTDVGWDGRGGRDRPHRLRQARRGRRLRPARHARPRRDGRRRPRTTSSTNIVGHASDDVSPEMQLRVVAYWTRIDAQIGRRVAEGLGRTNGSGPDAGDMRRAQELVDSRAGSA